ncbi:MAG: pyridoxine 5'-phosphate synthase [Pseudomonadota bacterium]
MSAVRPTRLSVNLNAIAYLRNRRDVPWPDLVTIARDVMQAGAFGLTVHPRPDERHIRRGDVFDLAEFLQAEFPQAEFNIEGYPTDDFMRLLEEVRPDQATLVPDAPGQSTSDHGWAFDQDSGMLAPILADIATMGLRSSVFVDPNLSSIEAAQALPTDRVELYTGPFGAARNVEDRNRHLADLAAAAAATKQSGKAVGRTRPLGVNAGHDLSQENLPHLLRHVSPLDELSIGHALMSDAMRVGYSAAVARYLEVIDTHSAATSDPTPQTA